MNTIWRTATGPQSQLPSVCRNGSGLPVVLEAGLGEGPEAWDDVTALLESTALVLRPRRWGLGGEPWVPGLDRRAVASAERLHAAVRLVTPQPFILVAHSLGGLAARALVRLHPTSVTGLVLVDPTVEAQAPGVLMVLRALGAARASLAAPMRDPRRRAVVAEQRAFPGSARQVLRLEDGPATGVPTVILSAGSGRGWEGSAAAHERLALRIGARHLVVAGAGHHIQHSHPALLAHVVTGLLERSAGKPDRRAGGADLR